MGEVTFLNFALGTKLTSYYEAEAEVCYLYKNEYMYEVKK